jgi:hypothetical protein
MAAVPDNSQMNPSEPDPDASLRVSDAERDRAASVLSDALAEGMLTAAEHSERLDLIYAARTRAELVPVLADIAVPASRAPAPAFQAGQPDRMVAVFGGASRKGAWRPSPATTVVTVFGGANIDLRDAVLPGQEIEIRTVSVFGGVSITIPPHMRVIDSGTAVFGGRDIPGDSPESQRDDAPLLRLHGSCVFGGVSVSRQPPGF